MWEVCPLVALAIGLIVGTTWWANRRLKQSQRVLEQLEQTLAELHASETRKASQAREQPSKPRPDA